MNRVQTASPPLYLQPRRARLRGRPSGLKGRSAIAARRTCGPPLTPEPLRPLIEQRHGQTHGAARQATRRSTEKSLQTSLYGSRGLPKGVCRRGCRSGLGRIPAWRKRALECGNRGRLAGSLAAAPRFLLATAIGAFTPGPREAPAAAAMSGTEFEDYVARIARSCGVPVIMTSVTGDWGVDLIVGNRPDRLAVQCKRHSRPVGASAVQEVVAGAPMHGLHQDHGRHQPRIHARRTQTRRVARLRARRRFGAAAAAVDDPTAHRAVDAEASAKRVAHGGDRRVDLAVRHRQRGTEPDTVGSAGEHDHAAIPQLADQLVALRAPTAG